MTDPSSFFVPLLWAAAQVTAVTLAAAALHAAVRRAGPRVGGRLALLGLFVAAGLSLGALSPWPRWDGGAFEARPVLNSPAKPQAEVGDIRTDAELSDVSLAALRGLMEGLIDPQIERDFSQAAPLTRRPRRASALSTGALLAAGLLVAGGLRFVVGWGLVARLRRGSSPISDAELRQESARLGDAAGVRGPVELRETGTLSTAAAIGWRRPAVLLPAGWRRWSPAERTAVLAHELAHVARRDAAANLLAQSALLTQFYHPLSHWLAGRVRLDQELAADALAAELVGDRAAYLRSLAAVALAASPEGTSPRSASVAWPARAFLPSPSVLGFRTLHERVEMLRRPPAPRSRFARRAAGPLAAAGLLTVAVLASGFRPAPARAGLEPAPDPVAPVVPVSPVVQSAPAKPQAASAVAVPDVLEYVPRDAQLVGVLEAKAMMSDPALAPIVALLRGEDGPEQELRENFVLSFADIERVAMYAARLTSTDGRPPVFVIRTVNEAPTPTRNAVDGAAVPPERLPIKKVDARTLIFSPGRMEGFDAKPAESAADNPLLAEALKGEPGVAFFVDLAPIRPMMLEELKLETTRPRADPGFMAIALGLARPLAANVDRVAGSVAIGEDGTVRVAALADAPNDRAAATVKSTLDAALTMAGNALDGAPALAGDDPQTQMGVAMAVGMARKVLDRTAVSAEGSRVTLDTRMDQSAPMLVALLLPAIQQARAAARRAQSVNNLKQIGLAMHNYHSTYNHFPPAVIVENGVKRSWRVELLPFLDQAALYETYDRTQPWDSEANKQVLAQMPEVFKHPADGRGAPFTAYVAAIGGGDAASLWMPEATAGPVVDSRISVSPNGGGTVMMTPATGTGLRDVRDGTTNTIMVVEAKTEIPWTKPEDADVDLTKPVDPNRFGGWTAGGFDAVFGDGSVRFLPTSIDPETLRGAFTRNGREVIELP